MSEKESIKRKAVLGGKDGMVSEPNEDVKESIRLIEDLKFFLATAPANWQENQVIRRYYLNHDEGFVSCIYWNNLYFITGTDIVRCIVYKFQHFGRRIVDRKKFEEGIFSDLRNLKCGVDAILEPPKSEFLEFLYKNSCLRTQKKQKVFFWFNVPHDKLMADALERDMKKEKMGQPTTTVACKEPAVSFIYDEDKFLFNQLADHMETQKSIYETPNESTIAEESPEIQQPSATVTGSLELTSEQSHIKKENPEYDDDFPLDYFYQENLGNDYITLDPNVKSQLSQFMEDEMDFFEPLPSSYLIPTSTASEIVHNEEYLIEQTQPIKTPIASMSSAPFQRKPLKVPVSKFPLSNEESFSPSITQPLSAKHHNPLGRSATPQYINDQFYYQQGQNQVGHFHDFGYHHGDFDYCQGPGVYEPLSGYTLQQGYMCLNDEYISAKAPYQVVSPAMMNMVPSIQNNSKLNYFKASSRQQAVSSNMMMKKFQMGQMKERTKQSNVITKPTADKYKISTDHTLEDVISSKSTKIVNYRKEHDVSNEQDNENFIPTPESSVTHSEQYRINSSERRN